MNSEVGQLTSPFLIQFFYVPIGVGYMAWKWIRISLESRMVSWYQNKIVRAGVSNRMRQCLNFGTKRTHSCVPGLKGEALFSNLLSFLVCLLIVD
jgi:hypothetical protein